MPDQTDRISRLLDELASITDQIGFEATIDAVSLWEYAQSDAGQPDWRDTLGAGLRHALTMAEDAEAGADMCHIRIDWHVAGRALSWRFDAGQGAGPDFGATITAAVAHAIAAVK